MRIIGGKFKGHALAAPPGQGTRPTSDRVREAIFNILAHGMAATPLENKRVLDLFAGSGAMGLEALSRGARFCQFVDEAAVARGIIRRNADALGVTGQCKIWRRDAARLGRCAPQPPFDVAFIDPPYGMGLGEAAIVSLSAGQWLAANALIVLEESRRAVVTHPSQISLLDQRDYGDTKVLFLRAQSNSPLLE